MTNLGPDAAQPTEPGGEALQVEISRTISTLTTLAPAVARLIDTFQRGLGLLTYEAKQAQSSQHRKDRRDLQLRLQAGQPVGPGASPNPGNINGLRVDVELWATVQHQVRRLNQWQRKHGTAVPESVPEGANTEVLLQILRRLVWATTDDIVLAAVLDDLRHVQELAETLVDGNDQARLAGPCPHCGRTTLIVTFGEGSIRCEKDPLTGRHHPCTCPDPICACKTRPVEHRHTWWRHKGRKPDGWLNLADRLHLDRLATKGNRP